MRREFRYMVVKVADANRYLSELDGQQLDRILNTIDLARHLDGKQPLECVVVESDWPEYEPTWAAIAARVDAGHNASLTGAAGALSAASELKR